MAKIGSAQNERPIVSIGSAKLLGMFATFLFALASGFLALVVHVWDDVNKHMDKIDAQLASLNVTQGKFEQFLTSQLPGISQGLQRNTELTLKLESNVDALTQSVSKVQLQVSIAAEEIQKLKDTVPMRKGSLIAPVAPTSTGSESETR